MEQISTKRKVTLNNGMEFPCIGYGTYQIRKKNELENGVKEAYKAGYKLIDTAVMYGNEKLIGDALKKYKIPRKEILISTKITPGDMTYERTKKSIDSSIQKLQCEYLDLVLIHWPEVDKLEDRIKVWKALEESVDEGKVKMIGVSNFCKIHLQHILKNCKIKPVINQIECNPIYWDKETIDFCNENNIYIEAYCPLAEWSPKLIKNETIVNIAKQKNKTVAQTILRYLLQRNVIPLPKSVHTEYIKENIDLDGFSLTDDEMKKINELNSMHYKIDWDPYTITQ